MLLCDAVRQRRNNPLKVDLLGLLSIVRPHGEFPFRLSFSVFLEMTGGRGSGQGKIRVIEADTDVVTYDGDEFTLRFDPDPTTIHPVSFHVATCEFHKAGLYTVEFVYNGQELSHQDLLVKEPS
jgi:hypothetical protein